MKITFVAFALCCGLTHAQGTLTPPGAPAPTMKTLDQIEPRHPLVAGTSGVTIASPSGQITIDQPGSYYLTGNLTVSGSHGIVINSNRVTIDLMGHTIRNSSVPLSWSGILIDNFNDISISNGVISGDTTYSAGVFTASTGFHDGVRSTPVATNIRLSDLTISRVRSSGITITDSSLVKDCAVFIAGDDGIRAGNVDNCLVDTTGHIGISASQVRGCRVLSAGFTGIDGLVVTDSRSRSRGGSGIVANRVESSTGIAESNGDGISAANTSSSNGESYATSSTGRGISSSLVTDSFGVSDASHGISGVVVSNSRGRSNGSGSGISGEVVNDSQGYADTSALHGLDVDIVSNSIGQRQTTVGGKFGIFASRANFCKSYNGESIVFKYNMP